MGGQCLKLEFALLAAGNERGLPEGAEILGGLESDNVFATASLMVTGGGVEVLSVQGGSEGGRRLLGREEEEDSVSVPIHLFAKPKNVLQQQRQQQEHGEMSTPIHSIASATSDLPPSPTNISLQSGTWFPAAAAGGGGLQADGENRHKLVFKAATPPIRLPLPLSAAAPLPSDYLSISCPGHHHPPPQTKPPSSAATNFLPPEALLLKVASPPSPPLLPPLPMSPAEAALGSGAAAAAKGVRVVETSNRGVQTAAEGEKGRATTGQQTATPEVEERGTQVDSQGEEEGGTKGKGGEGEEGGGEKKTGEGGGGGGGGGRRRRGRLPPSTSTSSSAKESESVARSSKGGGGDLAKKKLRTTPTLARRGSTSCQSANAAAKTVASSSSNSSSSSFSDERPPLTDAAVQTVSTPEEEERLNQDKQDHLQQVQDDLVARVLLEHAGTAFAPPDPRRTTNYLDLSKIGEEGETPASDEIWLAVEDGEELGKGFLTSSDEEEEEDGEVGEGNDEGGGRRGGRGVEVRSLPSTVETDKLSTAATMAGHVASRRNGGVNGGGGGEDREDRDLLEDLDEEAVRNEEVYVGVTARLQGVLSEELLPIQDTLAVTEKSVVVLAEKLQRMEGILQTLADKVGGEGEGFSGAAAAATRGTAPRKLRKTTAAEGKSIEGILSRIEELSTELSSVSTAKKLQEDNDQLRVDLDRFRQRETHLLSRIEVMEKAMVVGGKSQGSSSSRPSSRRSSVDATVAEGQQFPPIAKPREKKGGGGGAPVAASREKIEVGRAIQMLAKEDAAAKRKPRLRRGSLSDGSSSSSDSSSKLGAAAAAAAVSSDCLHTEIQIARSDNAILRQDLQVFRERESQLVKRNKELEEKLLLKRTSYSTSSSKRGKPAVESSKPITPAEAEAREESPSTTNLVSDEEKSRQRKAELDINIDFTLPGKAVIREKRAAEGEEEKAKTTTTTTTPQPQKPENTTAAGDKKHKAAPDEKSRKEVPKIKKPLQQNGTKAKPKPTVDDTTTKPSLPSGVKDPPKEEEAQKTEEEEGGGDQVKKATFDSEEWRVTVSSKHELDISSESPNTIVVTQSKPPPPPPPKQEDIKIEEKVVEEKVPSPPPPPPKPKPQVVQPKEKPKPKPKKASPPSTKAPPPPKPPPPPAEKDPRSDPIPKPPQFPVARPPRDYKPGKSLPIKKKRTSVEDIIRQDSVPAANGNITEPNGLLPQHHQPPPPPAAATLGKQRHSSSNDNNSSSGVIQMLLKEDMREVGLSDVPPPPSSAMCQVLK